MRDPMLLRRSSAEPKQRVVVPTTRSGSAPAQSTLVSLAAVRRYAEDHEQIEFRSIDSADTQHTGPEMAIVARNWAGLPG